MKNLVLSLCWFLSLQSFLFAEGAVEAREKVRGTYRESVAAIAGEQAKIINQAYDELELFVRSYPSDQIPEAELAPYWEKIREAEAQASQSQVALDQSYLSYKSQIAELAVQEAREIEEQLAKERQARAERAYAQRQERIARQQQYNNYYYRNNWGYGGYWNYDPWAYARNINAQFNNYFNQMRYPFFYRRW